jgi:hypothetical protein
MQILGLVLILINVGTIAGPVAGVALIYQNNLIELVIPPQVQQIVTDTIDTGRSLHLPQYVNSTCDPSTGTVTATFSFTNPFDLNLTINSMSADVQCHTHSFPLGHVAIINPVQLSAGETATVTIVFTYTEAAENHFQTEHAGETSIGIDLVNSSLDISGISVEAPQLVTAPNVPIPP